MSRIVIALGGNALGNNPIEQREKVKIAAKPIVDLIKMGHEVLVSHGNGPQVGMINLAFDIASKHNENIPEVELQECTSMSQGYIGYHLVQAIRNELFSENLSTPVVGLVTQIEVNRNDEAFNHPTKPIGSFYSKEKAQELMEKNPNHFYNDDAGRGWRRMVASPKPIDIIEKESIKSLINQGIVLVASGGGGIPVVFEDNKYHGIPAVIDKDFATSKLAEIIDADYLVILTAVDQVSINWGKSNQIDLKAMTIEEAIQYCGEGHFAPGSMLPKVEAAISFASIGEGKKAIIASLENASSAIKEESGTLIMA